MKDLSKTMEKLMISKRSQAMAKNMNLMAQKAKKGSKLSNARQSALAEIFGKED